MTKRTLSELRNELEGKLYIIIKGEGLQRQFLVDAESEDFRFGKIKPTDNLPDDVIAVEYDKQLSYVGFAGRTALQCRGGDCAVGYFHVIDYGNFKCGDDDFYYRFGD